jgi:hypothetical protein
VLKKILSAMLAALVVQLACLPASAAGKAAAKEAERVRARIAELGTGPEARVELKLRDKTRLKGYVGEATAEHLTVVGDDGRATRVAYPQIQKAQGRNNLSGKEIAITVAVVALIVIPLLIWASSDE